MVIESSVIIVIVIMAGLSFLLPSSLFHVSAYGQSGAVPGNGQGGCFLCIGNSTTPTPGAAETRAAANQQPNAIIVDYLRFNQDRTGEMDLRTDINDSSVGTIRFIHNVTVYNGYSYTPLSLECDPVFHRPLTKAYYPSGERVDPSTISLSKVITDLTAVSLKPPANTTLLSQSGLQVSNITRIFIEPVGGVVGPSEDIEYQERPHCNINDDDRQVQLNSTQRQEVFNLLK